MTTLNAYTSMLSRHEDERMAMVKSVFDNGTLIESVKVGDALCDINGVYDVVYIEPSPTNRADYSEDYCIHVYDYHSEEETFFYLSELIGNVNWKKVLDDAIN